MRVLIYGFSGRILGGIETFILNMNERMSQKCIFDYIIDGEECVYKDKIKKRGGNVFYVPGVKKNPFGYVRNFIKILKTQKDEGTFLLYIQLFSMANVLPALLAKSLGYKVVLHAHNNGLQSKSRIYSIIHKIGKRITKRGDYIRLTNSSLSSDFMFGKGIKSELVYNAIDRNDFCFSEDIRTTTRKEQDAGEKLIVGFVGRFSPQKNPVFMLKVFGELVKIVEHIELWIVGEGEMKGEMEAEVEALGITSHIKWLGRRNDVNYLMQGMDLLLQPSIFEGLGIVLVEAQATGLPVITSSKVVPQEAAVTALIRFVDLDRRPHDWAIDCIEHLKTTKREDREEASKRFPEYFDISNEATRLENLLTSI